MPENEVAAPPTRPGPAVSDLRSHLRRRNDPRFRIFVVFVLAVLVIAGIFLWRYFTSYESTDDAQIDAHVNSISPRISGHVIKLNVQDNQYVDAGTVLVEIDPDRLPGRCGARAGRLCGCKSDRRCRFGQRTSDFH